LQKVEAIREKASESIPKMKGEEKQALSTR
jgi:hypothetical protein